MRTPTELRRGALKEENQKVSPTQDKSEESALPAATKNSVNAYGANFKLKLPSMPSFVHVQNVSVLNKERTAEQKKELETYMIKPLDQKEVDLAIMRIKELKPLYRVPIQNLFPFLCCCFKFKCGRRQNQNDDAIENKNVVS